MIESEHIRLPDIMSKLTISRAQAQIYMKILKDSGIVVFQGTPKQGGYKLTEQFKIKISLQH